MGYYEIEIKGTSGKTSHPLMWDGYEHGEDFTEYLGKDEEALAKKLEYGFMSFVWETGKLYTITRYRATEALTPEELEQLKDYTVGQWSDGIGENFEQINCLYVDGEETYISPWHSKQKVSVTQSPVTERLSEMYDEN